MRIYNVSVLLLPIYVFVLSACGGKPNSTPLPDHMTIPQNEKTEDSTSVFALWFTTSNYSTGGKLGRLDLKTGFINRSVLSVGTDTQIFTDGTKGLLLLSRMNLDSVTALNGSNAEVTGYYSLPKRIKPQGATRDSHGRVWVTTQESNQVFILSPDLKTQVGNVNLSVLKESSAPNSLADLAQIIPLDKNHMTVSAQRLHRSVSAWKPDSQSGFAVVNTDSLQIEYSGFVNVSNPIQMANHAGKTTIVGAGDLSSSEGDHARIAILSGSQYAVESSNDISAKVVAADLSTQGEPPTVIAWYQKENKSCIEIGTTQFICDGSALNQGYVFNSVRRLGKSIFISYIGSNNAELWIVRIDGGAPIQKIPMDMPIQSMTFGP
jgi:hypothetical protein